jgi:enamine deaminase RidA (YjgF/YER057c/UK114 family)
MGRRQHLEGSGLPKHPQPFPTAVKLGNMVFTSALGGADPETGKLPDAPEEQIRNAFHHLATAMRLAGGSVADVGKVTVYLKDRAMRELVNPVWIATFPDENDRPVRHTVAADLPGKTIIQIEAIGVLAPGETDGFAKESGER